MEMLFDLVVSLQYTVGPSCFMNYQGVLPDFCLEVMAYTVFLPTVVAAEMSPLIRDILQLIVEVNQGVLD